MKLQWKSVTPDQESRFFILRYDSDELLRVFNVHYVESQFLVRSIYVIFIVCKH